MLWMVAWEQTPCASLPDDDALIAARIGMAAKTFAKHKAVLLRGWWKAEDGRLYHDVMVERVAAMLAKREKDQKRTAANRAKQQAGSSDVASVSRVTSGESHASSTPSTKHQAPIPEPSGSGASAKPPRATRKCPDSFVVTEAMLAWVNENCPTALVGAETDKFRDHTFKTAISDWQGAWRNWIRKSVEFRSAAPGPTFRELDEQRAIARVHETTGGLVSAKPFAPRRDALQEVFDAPRRLG